MTLQISVKGLRPTRHWCIMSFSTITTYSLLPRAAVKTVPVLHSTLWVILLETATSAPCSVRATVVWLPKVNLWPAFPTSLKAYKNIIAVSPMTEVGTRGKIATSLRALKISFTLICQDCLRVLTSTQLGHRAMTRIALAYLTNNSEMAVDSTDYRLWLLEDSVPPPIIRGRLASSQALVEIDSTRPLKSWIRDLSRGQMTTTWGGIQDSSTCQTIRPISTA